MTAEESQSFFCNTKTAIIVEANLQMQHLYFYVKLRPVRGKIEGEYTNGILLETAG